MRDSVIDAVNFIIGVFLIVIGMMISADLSAGSQLKRDQESAIKAGVAKYIVNQQTGKVSFVWIKPHVK